MAIRLYNMVSAADVADTAEYNDLLGEIRGELARFGVITVLRVPREGPEVGLVHIAYANVDQAIAAANAVGGRIFAGKTIEGVFE